MIYTLNIVKKLESCLILKTKSNKLFYKRLYSDNKNVLVESVNGKKRQYGLESLTWEWTDEKGSSPKIRLAGNLSGSIASWFRSMFLPVGFPDSVHPCYTRFHYWQFFETLVGSTVSVLCSQALLSTLGVGTVAAAGGAVAIQWVLKDGFGELGKLYFIKKYAKMFDSHPKTWKLIGEVTSLLGSTVQLSTNLLPGSWFLPLASIGYTCRSLHFSVWGATHTTFARCFALRGNVGDLVAKDDSQMSLAHILGLFAGVGYLYMGESLFYAFAVLGPVHFVSTIYLLRAADFKILNEANLTALAAQYVETGQVLSKDELKPHMKFFGEWVRVQKNATVPCLGASLQDAFGTNSADFRAVLNYQKQRNYLCYYRRANSKFYVVFHRDAGSQDVIEALLVTSKWQELLRQEATVNPLILLPQADLWVSQHKEHYHTQISELWDSSFVFWRDNGVRLHWDKTPGMYI